LTAQFSLVVSAYEVAAYIDEFLASLAAQEYPLAELELVFVDDGSTDGTAETIARWIAANAPRAVLVSKANGGLSSARNAGLERVTGTWVTFPDPDDTLAPGYFSAVAAFLVEHGDEVDLLATRLLMLDDVTGQVSDEHPLRFRFKGGDRVLDLEDDPRCFHLSAASGFYRTDVIGRLGLRFDERIRPNFEDGHFTGHYLAAQAQPRLGVVRSAEYRYRRRDDASSLVQDSWSRPEKFTTIPRYGYLDLLQRVHDERGDVPVWLQNLVLYDLLWYFKHDERIHSQLGDVDEAAAAEFHAVLPDVTRHIDTSTIQRYRSTRTSSVIRHALIIGAKGERQRPARLRIRARDPDQRLVELRYFYGGEQPIEEFHADGAVVAPVFAKHRPLTFVGRRLASERIVWLPAAAKIEAALDGRRVPVDGGAARSGHPRRRRAREWVRAAQRLGDQVASWAQLAIVRVRGRRYADAWVFTDRNRLAGDNAEHLCRHVMRNHPEINAWFVIDRDAADWTRLAAEGFRLVQHGTAEHRLLMLNCAELISSQIEHHVVHPIDVGRFGRRRWRFTFLQHGVTKDDLSRWLNRKPISCFVTATEAERRSIAGDGTPYVFTDKEVRLTGFPRHDRLLRLAAAAGRPDEDRVLLVMPTWRRNLVVPPVSPGGDYTAGPDLHGSEYARAWADLLGTERLGQLADKADARVAFVPHPNASMLADVIDPPPHVDVHRYGEVDIQDLFVRGVALITDYSSNAFELAYLGRPVIYFQFDRDSFFSGQHVYRRGSWSYERDGFGPVATTPEGVLDELERLLDLGMEPPEPYATRMAEAFAFRDGNCSERVVEAIRAMRHPVTRTRTK
jgi:glycosyltransferase involved in cell wall biosynthesis